MIYPTPFHVDGFAGGGGASEGFEVATGLPVAIALNHDRQAVAMHRMNHPFTKHYTEDIRKVDPVKVCGGRQPTSAWFSPDCKDFSKAKGGKPKSKRIRGLAWTVIHWVNTVRPLVIYLENVEEFVIVDIGMRMLTPRELYRAQGFGDDYIIDRGMEIDDATGKLFEIKLTKTAQVRMCGNSVCPPMACALIRANQPEYALKEIAA